MSSRDEQAIADAAPGAIDAAAAEAIRRGTEVVVTAAEREIARSLTGSACAGEDGNALQQRIAEERDSGEERPLAIGVLLSGSGTNLQALIDAIAAGELDAEIKLVVASRPSAYGLKRAEAAGIQTLTLSREMYADPLQADEIIAAELLRAGVDYVVMAGYMRMVHAPLLATFKNRVVNIHPALLPSFQGAHGIEDAYNRGVKVTGVTVHFANEVYDQGPIIAQEIVRIEEGMSLEELESGIHAVEHVLYPSVVQLLAEGRVRVTPSNTVDILPL